MLHLAEAIQDAPEVDLGPARVLGPARGRSVELRLEAGADVEAQLALALPYEPAEGDVVLVLSKAPRYYVVGVLEGAGRTRLAFRGDVEMRAMGGSLSLEADEGVRVRGRSVSLEALDLEVVAKSLVQRLGSVYARVQGMIRTRAKETHTVVEGSAVSQAKTTSIVSEEAVRVNGEQIHLG